jgi:hypothetical protein
VVTRASRYFMYAFLLAMNMVLVYGDGPKEFATAGQVGERERECACVCICMCVRV